MAKKFWIGCSFVVIAITIWLSFSDLIFHSRNKIPTNPDSECRYKVIQSVLDRYKRPFTLLEIGASQGYFSFKAAPDYESVCVMIDGGTGNQLLDLCKANGRLDNLIFLNKPIVVEDLRRLSECEAFDVVLAFNLIHKFWKLDRWRDLIDTLLSLGDMAIIETPPEAPNLSKNANAIRRNIENYLISKNGKVIGRVPSQNSPSLMSSIYLIEGEKKQISRKTWVRRPGEALGYEIHSNCIEKTLKKVYPNQQKEETCQWIPGINLITFKMYNGAYPTKELLKASLKNLSKQAHSDWGAGNMILQGSALTFVDKTDPNFSKVRNCSKKKLDRHLKFVDLDDPQEVELYFWEKLAQF